MFYTFLIYLFPFFFFLRLRPPPRSTLFPYTTLFRSLGRGSRSERQRPYCPPVRPTACPPKSIARSLPHSRPRPRSRDRKSTRLNSSHRCISYAVFCLKKKKKTKNIEHTTRLRADAGR